MFRGDLYLPDGTGQPSALAMTPEHGIRWLACRNMFTDWIPPLACMMLHGFDYGGVPLGSLENGPDDFWPVTRCGQAGEDLQNPAVFFFNGPTAIPPHPHGWGRCTRDYPALVLHDGRVDGLGPSMPCGPVKDKWYVASTGHAWTCMGHRLADDNVPGYDNVHTVWVTGERTIRTGNYGSDGIALLQVAAGQAFGFPMGVVNSGKALSYSSSTQKFTYKKGLPDAILLVGFGATIYSTAAPRGAQLIVSLTHQRKGGAIRAVYKGMREQDIEQDTDAGSSVIPAYIGKENVALNAILDVQSEDTIRLENESAYQLEMLYANFCFGQFGSKEFITNGPGE